MHEDLLDLPDDSEKSDFANARIVAVKFFYFESNARIYAARLKEAGINSFISNANTSTVIPFGEGGIGLHVKQDDLEEAVAIIEQLDINNESELQDVSFRDADKEDIAYEKEIRTKKGQAYSSTFMITLFFIIVLGFLLIRSCSYQYSIF